MGWEESCGLYAETVLTDSLVLIWKLQMHSSRDLLDSLQNLLGLVYGAAGVIYRLDATFSAGATLHLAHHLAEVELGDDQSLYLWRECTDDVLGEGPCRLVQAMWAVRWTGRRAVHR